MANRRGFILLLLLLAGCGPQVEVTGGGESGAAEIPPEPEAERIGAFEGPYTSGFEISSFSPCDFPGERWWVSENLDEVEKFIRASGRDPIRQQSTVWVKWSGRASPLGKYGHLGGYQREFTIERVQQIRPASNSDCPPASE